MTDELEEEHFEEKPFLDHLDDLRMTLLKIIAATVAGGLVCLAVSRQILSILKAPIKRYAVIVSEQAFPLTQGKQPAPSKVTETQQEKPSPAPPHPETRIVVTGPLGGLVMFARDIFLYSRESLAFLNRSKDKVGSPGTDVSQKKPVKSAKAPARESRTRSAKEKKPLPTVWIIETGPAKGFVVVFKTAFLCGLGVTMPLNLLFLAQFIFPALTRKEKKYVKPSLLIAGGLFAIGLLFGYFVTFPLGLRMFLQWNARYGIGNFWKMGEYLSMSTKLLIANGLLFEMPLILTILVRIGIVSVATLKKKRKHAIAIIFILSAVLTPTPDALTMTILAVPMVLMYEACIWVSWFLLKEKRKREEEEGKHESYWEERKRIKRATKVEPEKKEEKPAPPEKPPGKPDQGSPPQDYRESYPYGDQSGAGEKPTEGESGSGASGFDSSPPDDQRSPEEQGGDAGTQGD